MSRAAGGHSQERRGAGGGVVGRLLSVLLSNEAANPSPPAQPNARATSPLQGLDFTAHFEGACSQNLGSLRQPGPHCAITSAHRPALCKSGRPKLKTWLALTNSRPAL